MCPWFGWLLLSVCFVSLTVKSDWMRCVQGAGADEDHLKRLGKSGWTYQAVQRAGLQGKSVVVFGSMDPR